MSLLDPLLFGGKPAGIYQTVTFSPSGLDDARSAVQSRGWDVAVIDGTGISSKAEFLTSVGTELHFPDWTTGNWDAMNDWITDLSWLPAESRVVIWNAPDALLAAEPKSVQVAMEIFSDAVAWWASREQHFSVVVATAAELPVPTTSLV